jgi:ferric-dicitrate binding protein FerR (iron transport regulator)
MNDELITASQLFRKLRKAEATEAERQELYALLREDQSLLERLVNQYPQQFEGETPLADNVKAAILQAILGEEKAGQPNPAIVHTLEQPRNRRVHFLGRFRWAAAAVLLIAVATFFLVRPGEKTPAPIAYKGNVSPGKLGSTIKLSDGRVVEIDTVKDGLVATESGWRILKKGGKIVYEKIDGAGTAQIQYNEVFAERGHESEAVQLPDGSVAWLNAGSSLKFPLSFTGASREVSMTGEVYFEVVHNAKQPFKVRAGDKVIEDIGTIFNVNAYANEPAIVITLVEGSLTIDKQKLLPNQQYADGKITRADVARAIAWHKGMFSFEHTDLQTMMRQIERWYNVEVKYEGRVPDETFTGDMKRNLTLAEVLDFMQSMHVKFRIEEDKRIVITP